MEGNSDTFFQICSRCVVKFENLLKHYSMITNIANLHFYVSTIIQKLLMIFELKKTKVMINRGINFRHVQKEGFANDADIICSG
jgi:hypothetical protein